MSNGKNNIAKNNRGKVVQIIGPVLDIQFEADSLPAILNAISEESTSCAAPSRRIAMTPTIG